MDAAPNNLTPAWRISPVMRVHVYLFSLTSPRFRQLPYARPVQDSKQWLLKRMVALYPAERLVERAQGMTYVLDIAGHGRFGQ